MSTETKTLANTTFCWVDLATTDVKSATRFYSTLFNWQPQEMPDGQYTMFMLDGKMAGGVTMLPDEAKKMGAPPHWLSYVQVADCEQTEKEAARLGATVLKSTFDMGEHGRMAVLKDPTGAVFALWQSKKPENNAIYDVPGALCWNELLTTDPATARKFYTDLFKWGTKDMLQEGQPKEMQYTAFDVNGRGNGGMMALPEEARKMGAPSHWAPYFAVKDTDNTVTRAKELGAKVHVPPMDIPPVGRFSVLADAQGAVFCVIKLNNPDA